MTRAQLRAQLAAETRAVAVGLGHVLAGELPPAVLPDIARLAHHAALLAAVIDEDEEMAA